MDDFSSDHSGKENAAIRQNRRRHGDEGRFSLFSRRAARALGKNALRAHVLGTEFDVSGTEFPGTVAERAPAAC